MNDRPNAQVVMAKCSKKRLSYGMRVEEKERKTWHVTWAFPISDKRARAEKYENTKIEGSFVLDNTYKGCPYCGMSGFFSCYKCGKISCWDGAQTVTCAHCDTVSDIGGTISELDVGGDL